ncbi:MAG: heme ABC exporter ATP-binding protein CcmA [Sphingomicrobium sp.]
MTALLRLEGVALARGGRLLFEGLDLALEPGGALQVGGPNGSGKSSLLRLAAGLLSAERGQITAGQAALADDLIALDRELPLARALDFWAGLSGNAGRREAAMAAMGLAALGAVPVRILSSGQLRRAAIARVIASGAPLWLLDEPLNALDRDGADRLAEAITTHRKAGGAVLAASHAPLPGAWARLELGP